MRLAEFIAASSTPIISEWEEFARTCEPTLNLAQRRDHVEGMLKAIALDLDRPQTKGERREKAKGNDDAHVNSHTAANAHGTDRAALGYTAVEMMSEFRYVRASCVSGPKRRRNSIERGAKR